MLETLLGKRIWARTAPFQLFQLSARLQPVRGQPWWPPAPRQDASTPPMGIPNGLARAHLGAARVPTAYTARSTRALLGPARSPPPSLPPPPWAAVGRTGRAPSVPTPCKACPASPGPNITGAAAAPTQAASAGQRPGRPRGLCSRRRAARVVEHRAEQTRKETVAERGATADGSHLPRNVGAGWLPRSRRRSPGLHPKVTSG